MSGCPLLPFAVALTLLSGVAGAQEAAPADPGSPTIPEQAQPAPDANANADKSNRCTTQPGDSGADQTLTGQLSACGGVLTPPPTASDSGIEVPAPDPDPNTTPVIPPQAVPDQQSK